MYKMYRHPTPRCIVQKIVDYVSEKLPQPFGLAVDVGCGSGQSTLCMAPYFKMVAGFDVSSAHIDAVRQETNLPSNVTFGVAPAEKLPVADQSVALVTGGCSFHWFDFPTFHHEVDRVLVPNGVVAGHTHTLLQAVHPSKGVELNKLMAAFARDHMTEEGQVQQRIGICYGGYKDLPLPYDPQVRYSGIHVDTEHTLASLVGTYATWPMCKLRLNPRGLEDVLQKFQEQFLKIMDVTTSPEETPLTVRYTYHLAMCRKPAAT